MISMSFSKLSDLQCPFRFHALHVAKTHKEEPTEAMLVGGRVAEILAEYRAHLFKNNLRSDIDFFSKFGGGSAIEDKALEYVELFKSTEFLMIPDPGGIKWYSIEQKAAFDENLVPYPPGKQEDAWLGKYTVAWRLVADFCYVQDDTLFIIDDKTGFGTPDPLQVGIYACLVPTLIPQNITVTRVCCMFNKIGRGKEIVGEYDVEDKTWQIPVINRLMQAIHEANTRTEWPAVACDKCRWCSVPDCPVREQSLVIASEACLPEQKLDLNALTNIATLEHAQQAVLAINFIEQAVDKIKDSLRLWIEKNGPVHVGGRKAELKPWKTWNPDVAKVLNTLVAYGVPREVIINELTISITAVKKILKKTGKLDKFGLIEALGQYKENRPRLSIGKDDEPDF